MRRGRAYLVEVYAPRGSVAAVKAAAERMSAAAAGISLSGAEIRHLHTVFAREEETCFHVLESDALEAVVEVIHRAGIDSDHIIETEILRR